MHPTDALQAPSHPDPYPWYRLQARGGPVQYDPGLDMWLVWSADAQREALAHPGLRVRPPAEAVPRLLQGRPLGDWFAQLVRMNDGPARHAAPKAALHQALTAMSDAQVDRCVDHAATALTGASWSRWAAELPVRTVAGLLGFETAAHADVVTWVDAMLAALPPSADEAARERGDQAAAALVGALAELTARSPLRTPSMAATCRQAGLDDPALSANLAGLLTQTCEATAGLLGNAVVALAKGAPLDDLPALVERVMRHDPPVHNTRRFAAQAVSLAGVAVPAGAALLVMLGAAETGVAEAPTGGSRPGHGMGFGAGPHACPGAMLARHIALAALTRRLATGAPAWPATWHYRPLVNARVPVFTA